MEWKPDLAVVNQTVSFYLRPCAVAETALAFEYSSGVSLILALILAACLCDTTVEVCSDGLFAPFWDRARACRLAPVLSGACLDTTSTHRLCTLSQNKQHFYAKRCVRISRSRAPPTTR
jgi:hypothetical protein